MNRFLSFMNENTKRFAIEEQKLIAEGRKDEANLMRIRQNVCGIGRSMYDVAVNVSPDAIKEDMLKRLNGILATWEANYGKALAYQDAEKIVVEETKLETLRDILAWLAESK